MVNIAIGGRLSRKFKLPNIELYYGPYSSVLAAHNILSLASIGLNIIGYTVGIAVNPVFDPDNPNKMLSYDYILEYWYNGGTSLQNLVPKQEAQVLSNWNQENSQSLDYIKNKPTNVSAFTNDAGYLTQHQDISGKANSADLATVATSGDYDDLTNKPTIPDAQIQSDWTQTTTTAKDYIKNKPNMSNYVQKSWLQSNYYNTDETDEHFQEKIDSTHKLSASLVDGLSSVATSGDYDDLTNKPTIPTVPTDVSAFNNDAGYLVSSDIAGKADKSDTYTKTEVDDKIDGIIGGEVNLQNYYTKAEVDASQQAQNTAIAAKAPQSTTYNKTEVDNLLSPKANSADLATVATSGSYNDLEDKPTIPDAQIQSDWNQTNSSAKDFIKNKPTLFSGSYNNLTDKPTVYTQQQVDSLISPKANASDLSTVATSGDYNDLNNKPSLFSGDYDDLSNKPSLFSGNYNDLTDKPTIPTITTDTVKIPVIEIFADRECTKHPNGAVNKVYAKFYKRFGFNEAFIAKDTTDPLNKYITVAAPTIEYPTEDYGLNWCIDFTDSNVPSTPYEFGDIIELQAHSNEDLDITGFPNIFYADGTVGYTPETKTPIAPVGFAQVFADKECTKYAYGYTNKVYIRLNRNQAAGENINYGSGGEATSMYVSAPELPTDSYCLNLWVDFNAEDRRTPYTAGVYECTCAFWENINTFNKIFGA